MRKWGQPPLFHFLTLARYVERNAKRANLVKKAEKWKWSSVWRREEGTPKQKKPLSLWPVPAPKDYINQLNQAQTEDEEEAVRRSIMKSNPYGGDRWVATVVKRFNLEQTLRRVGRPKLNNSG